MIILDRLTRTFQVGQEQILALNELSEHIRPAEYVAIMGPSGSGKSTLLNIIGCLDRPTSGSYVLDGEEVANLNEAELTDVRRHKIGFIFQSFHLVPRLSAAQNVELPMLLAGISSKQRKQQVAKALKEVGLEARAKHRPDQMSGGERQRVAIARATVMGPQVLLADEPTGNLDTRSGQQVLQLLESMRDRGLTLVLVTHDPNVARRADRIIVLRDGRILHRTSGDDIASVVALISQEGSKLANATES